MNILEREFEECCRELEISQDDLDAWGEHEVEVNTSDPNTPVVIRWSNGPVARFERNCCVWVLR